MEKRNEIKSIFKSNDPEELLVFKAASLKNEIRLYLNDTVYLAAIETEKGCKIKVGEEEEWKTQKKMTKKKFKKFIKIKRLPKNIEEVKKSSRFSPECGSRELIKGIAEDLVRNIIAIIFTAIAYGIISHFSSNSVIIFICFLSNYYTLRFIVGKLITKYGVLNFAIKPLNKVLTNIILLNSLILLTLVPLT